MAGAGLVGLGCRSEKGKQGPLILWSDDYHGPDLILTNRYNLIPGSVKL